MGIEPPVTATLSPPPAASSGGGSTPTIAVHRPDGRPVLVSGDRLRAATPDARRVASALAWTGQVDLVLHSGDPLSTRSADDPVPQVLVALTLRRVVGGTAVEVAGDLDSGTVPLVRDAIALALAGGPQCLYLHLAAVMACDSDGVDMIVGLHHRLGERGITLVAVAVPAVLQRVLSMTDGAGSLAVRDHQPAPLPQGLPTDVA